MKNPHLIRRRSGFSLVELMVAVVIGLLALLFATRLVINGESNKDAAVGGSDSMQNGMLAMFQLSGDASSAGWGLNDPLVAGCNTTFSDGNGYQLLTAQRDTTSITPLASVVIQSNGAEPDVISFNSGNDNAAIGSIPLYGPYAGEGYVSSSQTKPYGYNDGDVLVLGTIAGDRPCTLVQIAGPNPANGNQLLIGGTGYRYNPQASMAQSYDPKVTYMYNLGRGDLLHFHTWSVSNGVLLLRATELSGAEGAGVSVVDNVVSIKAQYGFDTRAIAGYDPNPPNNGKDLIATSNGMQVTQWSASMIDADGDGVVGGMGDYQRIAAVRIAVVARSKTAEKPGVSGACTATKDQPQVFTTNVPNTVTAVPMTLDVAVTGDTVDWKCYHYRTFETIVPILNSQYRP